jgi:hypothetical protein
VWSTQSFKTYNCQPKIAKGSKYIRTDTLGEGLHDIEQKRAVRELCRHPVCLKIVACGTCIVGFKDDTVKKSEQKENR